MKSLSYYKTTSISIPKKSDYTTVYYYRKGLMIGMKTQFDDDFEPPKNCVEEQVLDSESYEAHLKLYREDNIRLQNEFRIDLIAKYNMTHHLKSNKIFDAAWNMAGSLGYGAVEDYFIDLIELIKDDEYVVNSSNN